MTRRQRFWLVALAAAVLAVLLLRWLAQPPQVAALVMNRAGAALGLEISARGASEYRLRGTPLLVLRDVVVRERGAERTLLTAKRLYLTLPWSTLRSGGNDRVLERVELDAPQLDLPALQHWQATRPPSKPRLPSLTTGLRIRDGVIVNGDWRVDAIQADLPTLQPTEPLRARLRGRYLAPPLTAPAELTVAIEQPQALIDAGTTGVAVNGRIVLQHAHEWRLPVTVALSGPLHVGEDGLRANPMHLGLAGTVQTGDTRAPFALGVYGPLRFEEATWTLAPARIVLRPRGNQDTALIPELEARGSVAFGSRLTVRQRGDLAAWPPSWPALPPPLSQSTSPLAFTLAYDGATGLTDAASLQLQRDATRFDARFRLPQVLDWIDQGGGAPLPPLTGTLTTPQLEKSGATLQGVEVEFNDEDEATP